jgi:uncharacterized protein (TIGR02246 family)
MIILLLVSALQIASAGGPFAVLRQEWAQDLHDKRVEASVALYAPDATFIQPDGSRVEGRDAIRSLYQTITTTFDSDLAFQSKHVEESGNLAYDSGTYTETLVTRANGQKQTTAGSYLTVYRKGSDGRWRIEEQVWTGGPASH